MAHLAVIHAVDKVTIIMIKHFCFTHASLLFCCLQKAVTWMASCNVFILLNAGHTEAAIELANDIPVQFICNVTVLNLILRMLKK